MSDIKVTKSRFVAGMWEGAIQSAGPNAPEIQVSHLGTILEDVSVTADENSDGHWQLRISVPANVLGDGVQVFLITDADTGEKLEAFTIVSGEPLEDDIRADVELLRAELDMLKRAFRRHCLEQN